MNQKERLLGRLRRNRVDRAPFICPGGMMTMAVSEVMEKIGCFWPPAHSDAQMMARLTIGASEISGVENVGVPFCMTVEAEGMGAQVTMGTMHNEPRVTSYAAKGFSDSRNMRSLDISEGRAKTCIDAISILKRQVPEVPVIANLTGPISLATSLLDPLLYYRSLLADKESAHKLTSFVTESLIRFGEGMIEAGADLICIADPSASGEIIGKKSFDEFALPYMNRIVERFRDKYGIPTIVHICGDVRSLGNSMDAIATDALSVDTIVSINTLKNLAPSKISMGNISTYQLERGNPESLYKSGVGCLARGVDILAPACGISPQTPVRNILTLSRAVLAPKLAHSVN